MTYPADLPEFIASQWPDAAELPERDQHGLANILYLMAIGAARTHDEDESGFSFGCRYLERKLGRPGMKRVLSVGLIERGEQWHIGKATKVAWPTEEGEAIIRDYLSREPDRPTVIMAEGGKLSRRRRPVPSIDVNGNNATQRAPALDLSVPVDTDSLEEGRKALVAIVAALERGEALEPETPTQAYLWEKAEGPEWAKRRLFQIRAIQLASNNHLLPEGRIPQRYFEAASGRLYGAGQHLQNFASEVKELALKGAWDYDFENCHYSVLAQEAESLGVSVPAIRDYLERKKAVRATLAMRVGVSIDQIKTVLTALIYGAHQSTRPESAIPKKLGGPDKARALYDAPEFKALAADVKKAKRAYIDAKKTEPGKTGFVVNSQGKAMRSDQQDRHLLAHLLQGREAQLLGIALDLYAPSMLLLQHDGFAVSAPIDRARLTAEIKQRTGLDMPLSEDRIGADLNEKPEPGQISDNEQEIRASSA